MGVWVRVSRETFRGSSENSIRALSTELSLTLDETRGALPVSGGLRQSRTRGALFTRLETLSEVSITVYVKV